ncbi:MAG TPA: hypothetical protein VD886_08410 [Herpetosiphonaceae bacterium]|nr:hypothetical protein [Herpetosiphonaceae bacterium]
MLRPPIARALQRRGVLSRPSGQHKTPQRTRIALRLERAEPWFFYLGGACVALGFAPGLAPLAQIAFLVVALAAVGMYSTTVYSRR